MITVAAGPDQQIDKRRKTGSANIAGAWAASRIIQAGEIGLRRLKKTKKQSSPWHLTCFEARRIFVCMSVPLGDRVLFIYEGTWGL